MGEWSLQSVLALGAVLCCGVALAMPYHPASGPNTEALQQQAIDSSFELADKPIASENSYLTWLRYLLRQNKHAPAAREEKREEVQKRFTEFSVPYFKYRQDKRNDGIWIWMPAQGYVSVPKQQQAMENDASGKPGKIMRYGK